jgi:hypothetical protein
MESVSSLVAATLRTCHYFCTEKMTLNMHYNYEDVTLSNWQKRKLAEKSEMDQADLEPDTLHIEGHLSAIKSWRIKAHLDSTVWYYFVIRTTFIRKSEILRRINVIKSFPATCRVNLQQKFNVWETISVSIIRECFDELPLCVVCKHNRWPTCIRTLTDGK